MTIIHVNTHLDSLQSVMINTGNKSAKRTAVDDSDKHLEIMMDGFWDMTDKSA